MKVLYVTEEDDDYFNNNTTSNQYFGTESAVPKKKKRASLPRAAVAEMRTWLDANKHQAYPSDEVKEDIARRHNITKRQVANWFINARRRYMDENAPGKRRRGRHQPQYDSDGSDGNRTTPSPQPKNIQQAISKKLKKQAAGAKKRKSQMPKYAPFQSVVSSVPREHGLSSIYYAARVGEIHEEALTQQQKDEKIYRVLADFNYYMSLGH